MQGVLSAYLDPACPPIQKVPLASVAEKYGRLLTWATSLDPSLTRSKDMPHHAAVIQGAFHSMVMELMRPFLFQNRKFTVGPCRDARPKDLFRSSSIRVVEITRLYYARVQGTAMSRSMCCFIVPAYAANISLSGPSATAERRRSDFRTCMGAFMDFGVAQPMKEQLVRGAMVMAVHKKLFTKAECRAIMLDLGCDIRSNMSTGENLTTLTMDFERAVEAPTSSSVEVLADEFKTIMAVEDS
ncbi:hypothetical protein Slin15195_G082880 [Septoria linicola]|uniref:Uncharacterized protein n=1 Tax=Septoria linicola TaxID=215465 RepID=A0A9Q9AUD3_9PEZI|nr:hypothetical protein Slin15195_G082880 [Septoria linicola]